MTPMLLRGFITKTTINSITDIVAIPLKTYASSKQIGTDCTHRKLAANHNPAPRKSEILALLPKGHKRAPTFKEGLTSRYGTACTHMHRLYNKYGLQTEKTHKRNGKPRVQSMAIISSRHGLRFLNYQISRLTHPSHPPMGEKDFAYFRILYLQPKSYFLACRDRSLGLLQAT